MPEIKSTFTQGKMNKDLDERIIPNGQYRDAMNVQISTSDGSDIGTVQNILGNTNVENIIDIQDAVCVGSVSNEKNNKLYWFIKSNNIDAILEYTQYSKDLQAQGQVEAVLIDTKANTSEAVLKFPNKIITGINIIDDLLLWTDSVNEPRRINIERCKKGNDTITALSTAPHTKLIVSDEKIIINTIVESDMSASSTAITDITLLDASELKVGDRWVRIRDFYTVAPFKTITAINGNIITLSSSILFSSYIASGDKLYFERDQDIIEDHITAIKKNPLKPLSFVTSSDTENLENNKLFEKIFPRFSYRYKYEDGEYSTYAPFTDVVFRSLYGEDNAGVAYDSNSAYNIKEPYNAGMRNMITSIDLKDFVSPEIPKDVVQIDLLYKREDFNAIYILESINIGDDNWEETGFSGLSEYKGSFTVRVENIYAAIEENQLLRPWDNIPKVALAQEVTGNRVVYGNYKQAYDIKNSVTQKHFVPKVNLDYAERLIQEQYDDFGNVINAFETGGQPSVKSLRDYQVGVVYGDRYGRETPVFTSENGSLNIPWGVSNSSKMNQLVTSTDSEHPEWANYYKFFVKETSGEYYNLIMDALYKPTKEDLNKEEHVWLSFPSSDRNKVSKEDYIILKKRTDVDTQVQEKNKYKILDVKNEAPDSIKYKYLTLGQVDNGSGALNTSIFTSSDHRPAENRTTIWIHKTNWQSVANGSNAALHTEEDSEAHELCLSFVDTEGNTNERTERYKVASIRVSGANQNVYVVQLEKPISEADDLIISDPTGSFHELKTSIKFMVERKISRSLESFSGRFFVKIYNRGGGDFDSLIDASEIVNFYNVDHVQKIHWHSDVTTGTYDPVNGLINNGAHDVTALDDTDETSTITSAGNLTNTQAGWSNLLSSVIDTSDGDGVNQFFIDNMYMAASQPSDTFYARHSGQGWQGGEPIPVGDIIYSQPNSVGGGGIGSYTSSSGDKFFVNGSFQNNAPSGYKLVFGADNAFSANSTPHTYGMAFPTNSDIKLTDIGSGGEELINGIDGVVTITDDHNASDGIRRWKKSIHNSDLTPNVYPTQNGKKVIHLSFLAPGEDLHDNTGWSGLNFGNLCEKLQGIWGGGVFTTEDGSALPSTSGIGINSSNQQLIHGVYCEREKGNNTRRNSGSQPLASVISYAALGSVIGYHVDYKDRHEKQWDPAWSGGVYKSAINAFVQAIKTPGRTFRFKNDPSEKIYTITRVKEKRIYNHTPWRRMYKNDGSGTAVATGDSVEEAAITWAQTRNNTSLKNGTTPTRNAFKDKVVDFGRADNRRVCYIIHLEDATFPDSSTDENGNPTDTTTNSMFNSKDAHPMELVTEDFGFIEGTVSENPAIWETEPKESVDLDIYYEAGQAFPTKLTSDNKELFVPNGSVVSFPLDARPFNGYAGTSTLNIITDKITMLWEGMDISFNIALNTGWDNDGTLESFDYVGLKIRFTRPDGSFTTGIVTQMGPVVNGLVKSVTIEPTTETGLSWYNCFAFGNGIESNRIRDDFNGMVISKGVKANTVLDRPYKEEHRKNGLIYSGLYNSVNSINNLNQFIAADKITKDLNPTYGSIQKLYSRVIRQSSSLIAFCEDKVVSIISNKNALYNADGNPQIVASNTVLGDANAFVGDYGISQNPESFAKDNYRAYFTDKQRGAVLRLSMDGLTPISDAGMHDYFRDNLKIADNLIGTYDSHKKDYNLTLLSNFLPENVISNFSFADGQGGSTESFNTQEQFRVDPGFAGGSNYVLPTAPINVANNSDLDSDTTITNHDAIPAAQFQAELPELIPYNWAWSESMVDKIIYHKVDGTNYGDLFSVPGGETSGVATEVMWQNFTSGSGDAFVNSSGNPSIRQTTSNTATGTAKMWPKFQDLENTMVDGDVLGTNANNNPNAFPNAINSTTFHDEEYKVTFEIQNYLNPNDPTHHTNVTGGVAADNAVDVTVELWEPASSIFNELHTDGITSFFKNGNHTPDTASDVNYAAGWLTGNSHTYASIPLASSKTFSFSFALQGEEGIHIDTTDVNNKMHLSPILDFFNIHFKAAPDDTKNSIVIRDIKVEKMRKVTNPGNNTQQTAQPAIPSSQVDAWAEVEHGAFADWSASSGNIVLNQFAINLFGPDTGSGNSVSYTLANGTTGSYIVGTPNGVTAYNQNITGNYTSDDFLQADGIAAAYLTQDITNNPLELDKWYEVRLIGVVGSALGILVNDALDPSDFPAGFGSGDTLPGHLGAIGSGSGNNKIIFDDQGNNERIARWQQKYTGGDLNTLKILFTNFSGTIDRIEFADITEKITGGTPTHWSLGGLTPIYHYYSPGKPVYWDASTIAWNNAFITTPGIGRPFATQSFSTESSLELKAKDTFVSPVVTNDGYEWKFRVQNYTSGSLMGYVVGAYEAVDTGSAYGVQFDGVNEDGFYKVTFNFDGTTIPDIKRYSTSNYDIEQATSATASIVTRTAIDWGRMNKVAYQPDQDGTTLKLNTTSLKDATNYFTATAADSWSFAGFDPQFDNYIVFDDVSENLVFTNAPIGVSLQQNISNHNFTNGSSVQLKLDATVVSGSISGYFYNEFGKGFTFGPISSTENFEQTFVMDESVGSGDLLNTFVINVENEFFSGVLDNFKMGRVYPDFDPSTVTYSEDVKGWTSFKSFTPESGVNVSSEYYTIKNGRLWHHHSNAVRNWFYGELDDNDNPRIQESSITAILNQEPSLIKTYNTLNYEGTQSKINKYKIDSETNISNESIYNLNDKEGWYVESITTNKQTGSIQEFIEKEGKWFNYIKGAELTNNMQPAPSELSFQGLGTVLKTITV